MTTTTSGGDDGSILWTILKIVAVIILAVILIRLLISLVVNVVIPVAIIGLLGFLIYKLIAGSSSKEDTVTTEEPLLLEFEEEDPLEQRFRELERENAKMDRNS